MSLYKDASLVMIPSAYKDGKLYSIRPTDGSGDFTFSRGSNLAATRVDVNGLIEKGRENLLLQSNGFNTGSWATTLSTITGGQIGYDGNNNAWLLNKTAGSGRVYQNNSQSGVSTFSVYAKEGSLDGMRILLPAGTNADVYFDLGNGTIGNNVASIDAKIEGVGGGWYRCSVTQNGAALTNVRIYPSDPTGFISATGSIYIQDAQLESSMVATDYIETGTSAAQSGILEDMPRLDYSGGASCPSLLLEPQRTNLIPYSEYWTGWFTKDPDVTISVNAAISPDGTQNAGKLSYDAASRSMYKSESFSGEHTFSFWVKAEGSNIGKTFNFRLRNTSLVAVNHAVPLTGEWVRHDYQYSDTNLIEFTNREGTTIGTGGFLLWGIQVEQGSYPTSYIPTYGTSQTRSTDLSVTESLPDEVIGEADNYTIFFDISNDKVNTADGGNSRWLGLENSSGQDILTLRKNDVTDQKYHQLYSNIDTTYLFSNKTINKGCFVVTADYVRVFLDGVFVLQHTAGGSHLDLKQIRITYGTANRTNMVVSQLLLFPTALTDSECIALTTI